MVENLNLNTVEDTKTQEVAMEPDGYLEKVEKQAEDQSTKLAVADDNNLPSIVNDDIQDDFKLPANAIILPATQTDFVEGEKADVKKSIKWLKKWCDFMISKYGNRVFFRGE